MTVEILPDVIAVEVPETFNFFEVESGDLLLWFGDKIENMGRITLPEGNWAYLFCTADASEEQAQLLAFKITDTDDGIPGYSVYQDAERLYPTAKKAVDSLMSGYGLKQNYAVLKKIN